MYEYFAISEFIHYCPRTWAYECQLCYLNLSVNYLLIAKSWKRKFFCRLLPRTRTTG